MYVVAKSDRIRQGDLFRNIEFRDAYNSGNDVVFDFCVVITQDCDLEQDVQAIDKVEKSKRPDFVLQPGTDLPTNDKYLNTVMLCPAFVADSVRKGIHMASLGWTMQNIKSGTKWSDIENNNNSRYHFLDANTAFKLPDLVMDFKRVYALPRDYMMTMLGNKAAKLDDLFATAVSGRYSAYVSRVALPILDKNGVIIPER